MTMPFICFALGVVCAGFTAMGAYAVQKTLYENKTSIWGYKITWTLAILSTICFLGGSIWAAFIIAG
jgi:hypothetical protein